MGGFPVRAPLLSCRILLEMTPTTSKPLTASLSSCHISSTHPRGISRSLSPHFNFRHLFLSLPHHPRHSDMSSPSTNHIRPSFFPSPITFLPPVMCLAPITSTVVVSRHLVPPHHWSMLVQHACHIHPPSLSSSYFHTVHAKSSMPGHRCCSKDVASWDTWVYLSVGQLRLCWRDLQC
jgi:hypothetical protein